MSYRGVIFGAQRKIIARTIVEILSRTPGDTKSGASRDTSLSSVVSSCVIFFAMVKPSGSVTATDWDSGRTIAQ